MSRLDDIGIKWGTDKSSMSNDYLVQYEELFPNPEAVKRVAEIGVQRGGRWMKQKAKHSVPSLMMWAEFFPNAHIYGMDLKELAVDEERVTLFRGDQSSAQDLDKFARLIGIQCDLIIDDGSHQPGHQITTFHALKHCVKRGGYYIIEDCKATTQDHYPYSERIHAILERTDLSGWEQSWGYSNVSGEQSTKIMKKL